MFVGVLRLTFHIPHARSLKEKRHVVRKFRDRVRARFDVSIAEMSDDLRIAGVYVRRLEGVTGGEDETLVAGLTKASSLLRREVTKRVGLRYAPELRFFYDAGLDATNRIESLLDDIKRGK